MIKANELRIGNWVKDVVDGNYYQVKKIDSVDWDEYSANQLEYIPITPKILEKLSYYQYDEENKRYVHTEHTGFGDYYMEEKALYFGTSSVKVEYLHDLQNLLFALTRKEIIYKP